MTSTTVDTEYKLNEDKSTFTKVSAYNKKFAYKMFPRTHTVIPPGNL